MRWNNPCKIQIIGTVGFLPDLILLNIVAKTAVLANGNLTTRTVSGSSYTGQYSHVHDFGLMYYWVRFYELYHVLQFVRANAMKMKSILIIILFVLGASFLNTISIIGNSAFAVIVGGVIGLVSFRIIFNQLDINIWKSTLVLILFQLTISCLSTISLETYCRSWNYQEWCNRNLFILSSFPLYVSIVMWLLIPIYQIYRKVGRTI